MKNSLIWKGLKNDNGVRAQVLAVGSRVFKIGDAVPVDIISPASLVSFKKSGALVEPKFEDIEDAEFTEVQSDLEYIAPENLDEDQTKEFEEIRVIYFTSLEEIKELEVVLKDLLFKKSSEVSLRDGLIVEFKQGQSENEEEEKVIADLVKVHSDNFSDCENALKLCTKNLNQYSTDLDQANATLKKALDAVKNKEEADYTDKQAEKIENAKTKIETIKSQIEETQKHKTNETQKFENVKTLLSGAKTELAELKSENGEKLDSLENELNSKNEVLEALVSEIDKTKLAIESKTKEVENAKEKLEALSKLDQ